MADLALDIIETQVLLEYPDDPNVTWHARILLASLGGPGLWVVATPTWSVQTADLNAQRIVVLTRGAGIPLEYVDDCFIFNHPHDEQDIRRARAAATALAVVLGVAPVGLPFADGSWHISDTAHAGFGDSLPASMAAPGDDLITRDRVGLAHISQQWVHVEYVADVDVEAWRTLKGSGAGRDKRLIGDHRLGGRRFISFNEALNLYSVQRIPGLVLAGPPLTPEYLPALQAVGFSFPTHHANFAERSGVSPTSGVCLSHKNVCMALHQFLEVDQVNFYAMSGIELLVRWLYGIEAAVKRNPRVPDFGGLEDLLATPIDATGVIKAPGFSHWYSGIRRDQAQVLKQERLWAEETGHLSSHNAGGGSSTGGGGNPNAARGKNQAKPKPGRSPAAAGAE
jgi:hypothetical protein